jgi:hypothetical protein
VDADRALQRLKDENEVLLRQIETERTAKNKADTMLVSWKKAVADVRADLISVIGKVGNMTAQGQPE